MFGLVPGRRLGKLDLGGCTIAIGKKVYLWQTRQLCVATLAAVPYRHRDRNLDSLVDLGLTMFSKS